MRVPSELPASMTALAVAPGDVANASHRAFIARVGYQRQSAANASRSPSCAPRSVVWSAVVRSCSIVCESSRAKGDWSRRERLVAIVPPMSAALPLDRGSNTVRYYEQCSR